MSARHSGQADSGIIAHLADCFQRHVSGSLDGPFDGMDRSLPLSEYGGFF
jgi:hypothetical protein